MSSSATNAPAGKSLDQRIEHVGEDAGEEKRREDRREQPEEVTHCRRDRDPGPELRRSGERHGVE
jgi:hypothetical protein